MFQQNSGLNSIGPAITIADVAKAIIVNQGDFAQSVHEEAGAAGTEIPVLFGIFGRCKFDGSQPRPGPVGLACEIHQLKNTHAITVKLKLGPDVLYYLADPSDKSIWQVLDAWSDAGVIKVGVADSAQGVTTIYTRPFILPRGAEKLRDMAWFSDFYASHFKVEAAAALLNQALVNDVMGTVTVGHDPFVGHATGAIISSENLH